MPATYFADTEIDRYLHVIRSHRAGELFTAAFRTSTRGPQPTLTGEQFLLGIMLSIAAHGRVTAGTVLQILNHGISLEKRAELGLTVELKAYHVNYYPKTFTHKLELRGIAAPDEQQKRLDTLQAIMDALLDGSLVEPGGGWYALDGTGVWARGIGSARVAEEDVREDEVEHETAVVGAPVARTKTGKRTRNRDDEAAWGYKTAKRGERETHYGYMVDAAVRVSRPSQPRPLVAERIVISPANQDVVAPSLAMLDSINDKGHRVVHIVIDRHYSNKNAERWAAELRKRGINQHLDLKKTDHGFIQHDRMKIAAGAVHCPATPDELGTIERPGFGASKAEKAEFRARIDQREAYSLKRYEKSNPNGTSRHGCPAEDLRVGCALRAGSVEVAVRHGLPVVESPPSAETAPSCCTATKVSVTNNRLRKFEQPHYWGSEKWQEAYNLRVQVEGFFGSLKNPHTENLSREITDWMGLPMRSLVLTLATGVCNVRHQRSWYAKNKTTLAHPLLNADPAPDETVMVMLDRDEIREWHAFRAAKPAVA